MNPNWLGVISAILALAAFVAAYRTSIAKSVKFRLPLGSLAVLAALPGVSFAAYYAHVLPEPGWYYQFRSIPGTELLVVVVGAAGGLLATLLPRVLVILSIVGVGVLALVPIVKPFIGPIPNGLLQDQWDGDVCLQSTPSTCGAASLATIMKHFAVDATEAELAAEAFSYSGGTEAWYLARAARARGFKTGFDFSPGFSPDGGLPAVVGVRLGTMGHFIPILGRDGAKFIIGDPLRGRELLSVSELNQRYAFTGFHLRIIRHGP